MDGFQGKGQILSIKEVVNRLHCTLRLHIPPLKAILYYNFSKTVKLVSEEATFANENGFSVLLNLKQNT